MIHPKTINNKIKISFQHSIPNNPITLQNHPFSIVQSKVKSNYKLYKISNFQHFQSKQINLSSNFNHFKNLKLINQKINNQINKIISLKNNKQHQNLSVPKSLHQIPNQHKSKQYLSCKISQIKNNKHKLSILKINLKANKQILLLQLSVIEP